MDDQGRRIVKIQRRTVEGAEPGQATYRLWDSELKGFGLKVTPKGVKTYFIWYRAGAGRTASRREFTIGRSSTMTPDEARKEALSAFGSVRRGEDPQAALKKRRGEPSIAELCDQYLAHGVALKKPVTVYNDRRRIEAHIKPLLGRKAISAVGSSDIARFMRDVAAGKTAVPVKPTAQSLKPLMARARELRRRRAPGEAAGKANAAGKAKVSAQAKAELSRIEAEIAGHRAAQRRLGDRIAKGGKGAATRTIGLLGAIFTYAVKEGLRADNPVRGVERYKDRQFQRFLSGEELAALGTALETATGNGLNKKGLDVIRLLALTGARKTEIEALRWADVDLARSCLRLADSKTGAKVVPIGAAALTVLAGLPRSAKSPFVFPSDEPPAEGASTRPYVGTPKIWATVRAMADLDGVRLHDLRHTYASLAAGGGQSLPIIGAILGHRDVKTTAQYAHLADDPVKAAADRTAKAAEAAMAGRSAEVIPLMPAGGRA